MVKDSFYDSDALDLRILTKTLPGEDLNILAAIVNAAWGEQITIHGDIMYSRIQTNHLFIAAYDFATERDHKFLTNQGVGSSRGRKIPIGLLETISITTRGDYAAVPKTYRELTNYGAWRAKQDDADTLMMVDVTSMPTRQGHAGGGEARAIIKHAKLLLPNLEHKYVWSFTPDILAVKRWHVSMGAKDTNYRIPDARNRWGPSTSNSSDKPKDVILMDYSPFISSQ